MHGQTFPNFTTIQKNKTYFPEAKRGFLLAER